MNVAAYLRLSREDGDKAESDSIANQRTVIADYLKARPEMVLAEEFADDGYSGTNFDRPAFQRMTQAVKEKKIDCIIVKDLSRLGRNYIETGRYLERIFPMLGVRFVSVLDNYDSAQDHENEQLLLAFRNIINDAYCRDLSVKIRSSLDSKRKNGEFIGSFAAFGYRKDERDHHHLVIDEYAAGIVRQIFMMKLAGYNARRIAGRLSEAEVPTPAVYKRQCGGRFNGGFGEKHASACKWSVTTVLHILKNEVYTGTMVQNKRKKINYKLKECRPVAERDWIRVEGTHEAIIPHHVFAAVQRLLAMDTRTSPKQEMLYPFSGVLKCAGCGENMIRRNSHRSRNGDMLHSYICSSFVHDKLCTSHNIQERVIAPAVFSAVQHQLGALTEAEAVMQQVRQQPENHIGTQLFDQQIAEAAGEERRYLDLQTRLYADLRGGIVSRAEYLEMRAGFAEKAQAARERKAALAEERAAVLAGSGELQWLENFKAVQGAAVLDRSQVVMLIDKILVHDSKRIEIIFRDQDAITDYIRLAAACRMEAAV